MSTPAFGRGGDRAVAVSEEMAPVGGNFRKMEFLPKIGKDKFIFLRYLYDSSEWFWYMEHPMVPTKTQPADWPTDRKWPEQMSATCRHDDAFKGDPTAGIAPIHTDCWVCTSGLKDKWDRPLKAKLRVLAVACVREEVIATQAHVDAGYTTPDQIGKRIGFKDATREVAVPKKDEKGEIIKGADGKAVMETVVEPRLIVVSRAVNNYFGGLQSLYRMFGTVCDRDYCVIQRFEDGSKDIDFQHVNLDPTPDLAPGTPSWKRYEDAMKDQGLDPESMAKWLGDRASDDYYATFFDPTKTAPPRKQDGQASTPAGEPATTPAAAAPAAAGVPAAAAAVPTGEVPMDALAAMRARVRGTSPAASPEAATESAPAAAVVPVAAGAAGLDLPN